MRRLDVTSLAGGLALAAIGALLVLDTAEVIDLGFGWLAPLLIGAVGLVLIASGAAARPRGAAAARGKSGHPPSNTHRPRSMDALLPEYRLAAGSMLVDLTELELPPGPTELKAHVDMGEVTVIVPAGASVLAQAHASVGGVDALGERRGGFGVKARQDQQTDGPRLLVEASTSMGQVTIARGA
ncbi:MAG TPA: LiaF domain-containing protein [Capillimicrobium sp.]|jgi:hypothetical protein